jgi:hypothetical protein
MRYVEAEGNNKDALALCRQCYDKQVHIEHVVMENKHSLVELITILNGKVDTLIDVAAGKNSVPLDVLKKLLAYLCGFSFAVFFGVEGLKELLKFWS